MRLFAQKEIVFFGIANIAIFLLALVINLFAWKFQLVSAGISGYGLLLSYLFHLNVGVVLFVINSVLVLLNWVILGNSAGVKAVWGYSVFSLWMSAIPLLFHIHQSSPSSFFMQIVYLSVLAILIALCISFVIATEYSVGSYSALYPVVYKFISLTPSTLFIVGDLLLTILTAICFGYQKAMLLLLHAIILSISLNYIMPFVQKLLVSIC